jgi:hypothetical protein
MAAVLLVFAHHGLIAALFFGPALLVVLGIGVMAVRDRWRGRRG